MVSLKVPWLVRSASPRLIIGALAFLSASLALWWFWLAPYLVSALILPAGQVLQWLMPDEVLGLGFRKEIGVLVMTTLAPLERPFVLMEIPLPLTRFTVVFPLFWGLVLATPVALRQRLYQLSIGTILILFPGAVLMATMYAMFLLGLTINHQAAMTEHPSASYVMHLPFAAWKYHLMGVARQLAVLVMPTVLPLFTWGAFNYSLLGSENIERFFQRKPSVLETPAEG